MRQSQWPLEVFLRDREWMQLSALYNRSRKIVPAMIPFTLLSGAYNPREANSRHPRPVRIRRNW